MTLLFRIFSRWWLGALLALGVAAGLRADSLRFADGEVVRGTFIRREGTDIIFKSKNLGVLRVPENTVVLEVENALPVTTLPPTEDSPSGAHGEEERSSGGGSPGAILKTIGRKVEKEFIGWWEPWKGRIAASLNIVNDAKDRSEYLVEAKATRDWTADKLSVEARYEYRNVNDQVNSDQIRGIGSWRHDLSQRYFTSYRPEAIRDRVNTSRVQPFPYFMLRQQLGVGYYAVRRPTKELRLGIAHEFFNVWALREHQASSAQANSAFLEGEVKLPWRISAKERLVWHVVGAEDGHGWEHEMEVTKKINDAVSFGLRQEFRRNHPDERVIDSERLRLLLTYDF